MGVITAEKLCFAYETPQGRFPALNGLDLQILDGEFVCVIGHSGCGKTTLLKILAGLQFPCSGQVCINGRPIAGPGADRAMVFQNYALFPWMTARNNVIFGLRQAQPGITKAEAGKIADEYLSRVDMSDFAHSYPSRLSGGMQQRVAIARTLAMDVDILLLDEPFGALDTKNRCGLQDLLLKLWGAGPRAKTVIFVTHDIDEALYLADRVIFMRSGKIGQVLTLSFPRPRQRELLAAEPAYIQAKKTLRELFYPDNEEAADEE